MSAENPGVPGRSRVPAAPRDPLRRPPSSDPREDGDAADPAQPIPPDQGKSTDIEIDEDETPEQPGRR